MVSSELTAVVIVLITPVACFLSYGDSYKFSSFLNEKSSRASGAILNIFLKRTIPHFSGPLSIN